MDLRAKEASKEGKKIGRTRHGTTAFVGGAGGGKHGKGCWKARKEGSAGAKKQTEASREEVEKYQIACLCLCYLRVDCFVVSSFILACVYMCVYNVDL